MFCNAFVDCPGARLLALSELLFFVHFLANLCDAFLCEVVVAHALFARVGVVAQRSMLLAFAACCGAMRLPFKVGMMMRMIYILQHGHLATSQLCNPIAQVRLPRRKENKRSCSVGNFPADERRCLKKSQLGGEEKYCNTLISTILTHFKDRTSNESAPVRLEFASARRAGDANFQTRGEGRRNPALS